MTIFVIIHPTTLKVNIWNRGVDFLTNLERLKLELNNKEYYIDALYSEFLAENGLVSDATYSKTESEMNLLQAVISVLETLSNDIDVFRKVSTEFATTTDAYKFLRQRISDIQRRITWLNDKNTAGNTSNVTFMYHT